MKKKILFLAVVFFSVLLAGCISIPLGDGGKLEVSKDGVSVEPGEEEESDGKEIEDSKEDAGIEEEETETGTEESQSDGTATGSNSCAQEIEDPRANDRALKQLAELAPPNFPLPECTKIDSVNESYYDPYEAVFVESYFVVEGYWADIFDLYAGYLEESGFGPLTKSEKADQKSAVLKGKTSDYDATFYIDQMDRDDDMELVMIRVILYQYDTPRE